jgi:hypothetical protein
MHTRPKMPVAGLLTIALFTVLIPAFGQDSPSARTFVTIAGKTISINYSAPSVRHRKIFGPGGLLSMDPTYPAWRAGANAATAFHTDATLDIGGLSVPKGNYTIYCWVADPDNWQLIISKETGQWGLSYNPKLDLGRVKMTMSKPPAPIETYKMTLSAGAGNSGKLELAWENHVASVPITVK